MVSVLTIRLQLELMYGAVDLAAVICEAGQGQPNKPLSHGFYAPLGGSCKALSGAGVINFGPCHEARNQKAQNFAFFCYVLTCFVALYLLK